MRKGIRQIQLATFMCATTMSLVLGALFDAYLLLLRGSNKFVGDVESVNGLSTLVFAVPVGYLADRFAKVDVLRCNSALGIMAGALLLAGVMQDAVALVVAGSLILSVHNQNFFIVSAALLAELTTEGTGRTKVIGDNATLSSLGRAAGPALQLIALLAVGASGTGKSHGWTTEELHPLVLCGLVVFGPYLYSLFLVARDASTEAQVPTRPQTVSHDAGASPVGVASIPRWKRWFAALLLEIGGLLTAVGSGMTFKFWPLFFKGDYGFSPAAVCAVQCIIWAAIAMAAQLSPQVAQCCGSRTRSTVLTHYVGTALLFIISFGGPAIFILPLVVLRNAVMNSNVPIVQSMIMDLVPSEHRGKWSGIASLRRLTWSGSAFLGGWLSDSHNYRFAFFITACFHSLSGIFVICLLPLNLKL